VILLYRPEYYFGPVGKDGASLVGLAEAIVAKVRDGGTGPVFMHFEAPFTLFEDRHRHGGRP
jgi:replicative DNA helicase